MAAIHGVPPLDSCNISFNHNFNEKTMDEFHKLENPQGPILNVTEQNEYTVHVVFIKGSIKREELDELLRSTFDQSFKLLR